MTIVSTGFSFSYNTRILTRHFCLLNTSYFMFTKYFLYIHLTRHFCFRSMAWIAPVTTKSAIGRTSTIQVMAAEHSKAWLYTIHN